MNILDETPLLRLEHEYEHAQLVNKLDGLILFKDFFHGDPSCGLIAKDDTWAVVGGEHLSIWSQKKSLRITDEKLKWIYAMRLKNENIIEILTDPWSEQSAIWELNTNSFEFRKIRGFDTYKGQEYTEYVVW